MKQLSFLLIVCLAVSVSYAQNFSWINGTTGNLPTAGVYGTQGVAAPGNSPGTRHGGGHWTDAAGNLWLFGGEGNDAAGNYGWLNDLWKYNVNTNQWTWMAGSTTTNQVSVYGTQGVPAASNHPGSREFTISWTDASGNFWLFGGDGFAAANTFGRLGDLWKYDPVTGLWTWMGGFTSIAQNGIYGTMGAPAATNKPGARYAAATWSDASGNLWMFGGRGFDGNASQGLLNDFWRFSTSTNQWTWMGGSTSANQPGNYGTLSVAAAGNYPGGREFPAGWMSASGIFYMFGGNGAISTYGFMNDLWRYDPATGLWTWISGSSAFNATGVYGSLGVPASSVVPGARYSSAYWKDDTGNLWLFGGHGYSTNTNGLTLNDLFRYNPCANQWTWMNGATVNDSPGTYGTSGVPAAANTPGGREYNTFWKGAGNTLWLFGGIGVGATATTVINSMNDLWRFDPPCYHNNVTATGTICSGGSATFSSNIALCEGQVVWYPSATGTGSLGSGYSYTSSFTAAASASVYTIYAQAASCTVSPRGAASITVSALPVLSVTPVLPLCNGVPNILFADGADTFTWSPSVISETVAVLPALPACNYTVQGTDQNGCTGSLSGSLQVHTLPVITIGSSDPQGLCLNSTATLSAGGATAYLWDTGVAASTIAASPSVATTYSVTGTDAFGCQNTATFTQNVNPLPSLTVTAQPVCPNTAGTLTAAGANSYTWSNGQNGTVTTVSPGASSHDYTVTGTNNQGCASAAVITQTVVACTGFKELHPDQGYRLYPNPNNGEFAVETVETGLQLVIFSVLGQKVFDRSLEAGTIQLRAELPPGTYYYRILSPNGLPASGCLVVE